MFNYVWRTRFVGQSVSAAEQHLIKTLFVTHFTFFFIR